MESRFQRAATGRLIVKEAILKLDHPQGSSLYAIKKEIVASYNLDATWGSNFVRDALKGALRFGLVAQVSGTLIGNGRFRVIKTEVETSESFCVVEEEEEEAFFSFMDEEQ
jgi:hypothetical protein